MYDYAHKLAQVVTDYCVPIREGEWVVIQANLEAMPLVEALAVEVTKRGAHPETLLAPPGLAELYFEHAQEHQLKFISPLQRMIAEQADVILAVDAPSHTQALASVDKSSLAIATQATMEVQQIFMQRVTDGSMRWNLSPYPTRARAQEAGMSFHAYSRFVYEACALHLDDPIAYWTDVRERQQVLVDWLADKSHAEVKGPGIDMSFDFGGRKWINCYGDMNFPDGEIFTGPIEDSVNGSVEFSYPGYYMGNRVEGVKLRFEDGVIVEASAEKGEDFLLSQLDSDEGARRLGEFAIGTNTFIQNVTGSVLFDEKIGGTVHMAVGFSIPESLGENQSSVHWDMVHNMRDGGEIIIDDELFYRSGEFLVE